ncbi:uncharacterized protein [Clytia hemisphaerica]|uniref:uncharacterized protein isoform X2 n=1 Tax=Clytia hemisphaerica TaxID=252671 RepID=UPI0034D462D3
MKFLASLLALCSCTKIQANEDDQNGLDNDQPDGPQSQPIIRDNVTSAKSANINSATIATFSINRFNQKKYENNEVKEYLLKILSRYDFIFIQEVQDESEEFIHLFIEELKGMTGKSYKYKLGKASGRKSKKNQLMFLYRDSLFTLIDHYQYQDNDDKFERQPFIAKFRSNKLEVEEFAVIGVCLHYDSVEAEINHLASVHEEMKNFWGDIPTLIMGNFMTGGSHISKTKLRETALQKDSNYVWFVDNIDTTVLKNKYCYDRIIGYGNITENIQLDSVKAFRFDDEFGLSMDEAKAITDHYPVEVVIGPKVFSNDVEEKPANSYAIDNNDLNHIEVDFNDLKISEAEVEGVLSIGSFNVQRFGEKKMNNEFVVKHLYKIMERYDLVLIQEVQDQDLENVPNFVENFRKATNKDYEYKISESLGRKTYKEQYLYIYRRDLMEVFYNDIYDDGDESKGEDTFAREPYIMHIKSHLLPANGIILVGAHIAPKKVAQELEEMVKVHAFIKEKFSEGISVVFMGDFNADGSYLSNRKKEKLTFFKDNDYKWILDEDTDTTLAKNDYTYDRIIIYGQALNEMIIADSAKAFYYDEAFSLTNEEAKDISDHYPVEFKIGKRKSHDEL